MVQAQSELAAERQSAEAARLARELSETARRDDDELKSRVRDLASEVRNAERERDAERSHRRKLEEWVDAAQERLSWQEDRLAEAVSTRMAATQAAELLSTEHEQLMHARRHADGAQQQLLAELADARRQLAEEQATLRETQRALATARQETSVLHERLGESRLEARHAAEARQAELARQAAKHAVEIAEVNESEQHAQWQARELREAFALA